MVRDEGMPNRHALLRLFSGSANPALSEEIAKYLGISLGKAQITQFADGETRIELNESVRGKDVFIIQPTSPPVNERTMELLIMVDAMKRASAGRINVVMPYYGYARQDRTTTRGAITAKMIANVLTTSGVDHVVCMDLHTPQIQGFFDISMDLLTAIPILAKYLQTAGITDAVVVSPDLGGVTRARELAERIGGSLAMLERQRLTPEQVLIFNAVGNIAGKNVIMIDDLIDTAGTIEQGARFLSMAGAKRIFACCTHPLMTGMAVQRLKAAPIHEVIVTNTIPIAPEKMFEKLKVLSVGKIIAETILAIHEERSVNSLFE
ncbi:MAG: PrsA [Firmicutes bacterium]|nr:PrsA [Bacillota bacterium]